MTNNDGILIHARRVIIFSPHPDDAELSCGGLISKRMALGNETHVVYTTDGRNSHLNTFGIENHPTPAELKKYRKQEAIEAQHVLGNCLDSLHFLGFTDGLLCLARKAALLKIEDILSGADTEVVILPSIYETHPDHIATYHITMEAIRRQKLHIAVYQYCVWSIKDIFQKPDLRIIRLNIHDKLETKKSAISKFATQISCFSKSQSKPILTDKFLQNFYSDEELYLSDIETPKTFYLRQIRLRRAILNCIIDILKYNIKLFRY
jgi:LmbE family N-acetylglucosaminyl deacetylase